MEKQGQLNRVTYGITRKVNLGNYESIDFFVNLSVDVPDGKKASEMYDQAVKFVEDRINDKVSEIESAVVHKPKKGGRR